MRAFVFVGGEIFPDNITEHPKGDDLVIAADSGWHNAVRLGEKPTLLVGDFDSIGIKEPPAGVELYQVPAEKNETDTELAVSLALSKGADEVVIVGGLSGRLDHTLANLSLVEALSTGRIHVTILDGRNRVRVLRNNGTLLARSGYTYFSLIAIDPKVTGVTLDGCKYPLKNAKIIRSKQYAVSNEIVGNCALIEVRRGGVYLVESKDA